MGYIKLFLIIFLIFSNICYARTYDNELCAANDFINYINDIYIIRATMYNALNLDECQIKTSEDLWRENTIIYNQKIKLLSEESKKMDFYVQNNFPMKEKMAQKRKIQKIKKDILRISQRKDREFKKVLTRKQRGILRTIKHLEIVDYKRSLHPQKIYKKNPELKTFGLWE